MIIIDETKVFIPGLQRALEGLFFQVEAQEVT